MEIKELEQAGTYSFDEVIIRSYMLAKKCQHCDNNLWLDYRFDAVFCPHCNEWEGRPTDMHEILHAEDSGRFYSDREREIYSLAKKIPQLPLD